MKKNAIEAEVELFFSDPYVTKNASLQQMKREFDGGKVKNFPRAVNDLATNLNGYARTHAFRVPDGLPQLVFFLKKSVNLNKSVGILSYFFKSWY